MDPTQLTFDAPGGPDAALCLHGLSSTPYELRPLCEALAEAGLRVLAPRLVGHGTRPELLLHTRWPDWMAAARRAFNQLAREHDRVFVVGLSVGALLALTLGHERGARVAGVVAMATPLRLGWRAQAVLRVAARLPIADLLPYIYKSEGPDVSDPSVAAAMPGYDRIPLAAAASLVAAQKQVLDRVRRIRAPVLVLHGRHDHVAPVSNALLLRRRLSTRFRRLIIYSRSWHILPLDVEHEAVVRDVLAFVADPEGSSEVAR